MRLVLKVIIWFFMLGLIGIIALDYLSYQKAQTIQATFEGTELDEVQYLTIQSLNIAYREYGEDHDDVLVLLHGFMGSSYDYHEFSTALADDYRVVAFDFIGFGKSDKPDEFDYSKENQAKFIKAALDALAIDEYVLVGHSMGGEIALRHTKLYEADVKKLVLFASAGLENSVQRHLPTLFYRLVFNNYYLQRLAFSTVNEQTNHQGTDFFNPMYYFNQTIPLKTLQSFTKALDATEITEFINTIDTVTLIIHGHEDRWIPLVQGKSLNQHLSNSQLIVLEGVGHMPFVEKPLEVLNDVYKFLED